jgi:hypothetical protein
VTRLGGHRRIPVAVFSWLSPGGPRRRTPVVLLAAVSLGITLTPAPSAAAPATQAEQGATAPGELVLPPAARAVPRATQILNAGTTGFLWVQEGDDRFLWADYASGTTTALAQRLPVPVRYDINDGYFRDGASPTPGWYGAGTDTIALYSAEPTPHVTLVPGGGGPGDAVDVPLPKGHSYRGTFGGNVLSRTGEQEGPQEYHLWRAIGATVSATTVTGVPSDARDITVEDGDARSVILRYQPEDPSFGDRYRWGMVDVVTGAFTALPDRLVGGDRGEASGFRITTDSIVRVRSGRREVDVLDRNDLSAKPRTVDVGFATGDAEFGVIGSTLLAVEPIWPGNNIYRGQPLSQLPIDRPDADEPAVLELAAHQIVHAPDGSALVAGAERSVWKGDVDWGVYRISQAVDGPVERRRVIPLAPMPAQIYGVAAASGIITMADNSNRYSPGDALGAYHSTWLTTPPAGGTPAVERTTVDGTVNSSDGSCGSDSEHCIRMFADGTGYHGRQEALWNGRGHLTMLYAADGTDKWGPTLTTGDDSPQLAGLSGRFAVVDGASSSRQYIGEFRPGADGVVLQRRDRVAAAVWGDTLWSGAKSGGVVTATRLPAGTVMETFTTRNGCTPAELQGVGRWVYWVCADIAGEPHGAGVYDRVAKRAVDAPDGHVQLGDGYLAVGGPRSSATDDLKLYDLHGGLPQSGSYTDLPHRTLVTAQQFGADGGQYAGPGTSWTVDRFGGGVVYADDQQRVHVVPTGVPTSPLGVIDSTVGTAAADWSGAWWLSKPAASWQIVFRDLAGTTIRTVSGTAVRGALRASWDGKDTTGHPVAGAFTWTLTAHPADGLGAPLTVASPAPEPLHATTPPSITGTLAVGSTVQAAPGSWTPTPTSYAYQWSADGVSVRGATRASMPLTAALLGKRLTVTVIAQRAGHPSGSAASAQSKAVAKGKAPAATKKPSIKGTPKVGRKVTARVGTWSPKPDSYRYEWRLDGVLIRGAKGPSLKLTSAMRKKQLTVTVVARKAGHADGKAISAKVTVRR